MNEVINNYGYPQQMLEHVFWGEIDSNDGCPKGFHCNRELGDERAEVVTETRAIISGGVFECKVRSRSNGRLKRLNDGYSTFFPESFTRQDILDCLHNSIQIDDILHQVNLGGEDIYINVHCRNREIITFYPIDPNEVI
ncbi:EndoU domain-containing protein [Streptococcus ruminantium]|uniref:EndoU domain-containing protein n=1 Tax=Streptococcus ruminantium TaxID=1917441 RepID=UPI0012DF5A3F|nr:EndoU domain-containing protein [Streptococcus ruminantium]